MNNDKKFALINLIEILCLKICPLTHIFEIKIRPGLFNRFLTPPPALCLTVIIQFTVLIEILYCDQSGLGDPNHCGCCGPVDPKY